MKLIPINMHLLGMTFDARIKYYKEILHNHTHSPLPQPHICSRRVHITQATLDCLGNEYEVEPADGHLRSQYLRDHNVVSYFIIPPPRRRKVCPSPPQRNNTLKSPGNYLP